MPTNAARFAQIWNTCAGLSEVSFLLLFTTLLLKSIKFMLLFRGLRTDPMNDVEIVDRMGRYGYRFSKRAL